MRQYGIIIIIICLVFINGCCSNKNATDLKQEKKMLKMVLPTDPSTLDPALSVDVTSGSLVSKIFGGLVKFDDEMKIIPDCSESFSLGDDGLVYSFKLREHLKFSDGTSVKSKDVLYSFMRVLDPESLSQRKWIFEDIKGVKEFSNGGTKEISGIRILSDESLEIELIKPVSSFLSLLAMPNAYIVKEEKKELTGCGPYVLKEFKRGRHIKLVRNDLYYESGNEIEMIKYDIIKDNMSAWASFSGGNQHVFNMPPELVPRFITSKDFNEKYKILKQPKLNIYYVCFNCSKEPFNDIRLRKAISSALNRDVIVKELLNGCAVPAHGPIPPSLRKWKEKKNIQFDLEEARRLLKEAGYDENNPFRFTMNYKAKDEIGEIIMVFKEQLKKINIELTPSPMEWGALKARINNGEVNAAYLNWTADYPSAHNFFYPLFYSKNAGTGGNRAYYSSEKFDKLMESSEIAGDAEEVNKIYSQMEDLLIEDAPWVYLWHEIEFAAVQKYVKGYRIPEIYTQDRGLGIKLVK